MIPKGFLEEVTQELALQLSAQVLQVWGWAWGGPLAKVVNTERGAVWRKR